MSTLHLEIVTIERKIFDDHVNMVVAPGIDGVLGILPRHTPLLTALGFGELKIKRDGQEDQYLAIGGGFMEVRPDQVIILADAADHVDEIDLEAAEAARQRAEEALKTIPRDDEIEFAAAEVALRRSAVQLKVGRRRKQRGGGGPSIRSSAE